LNNSVNKRFELLFFRRITKPIQKRVNEFISKIHKDGFGAARSWLENKLTNPELTQEIIRLHRTVGLKNADLAYRDLKQQERSIPKPKFFIGYDSLETKRASFGLNEEWINFIIEYLRGNLTTKITFEVSETLKKHLLLILNKAVAGGWGIDKTVSFLKQDDFSEVQAARIARTEVNRASNAGTLAAGSTYQYEMQKEWISVEDNRTRGKAKDHANHRELNETKIDFDDLFVDKVNGDRLRAPGDPNASAASTINCRCQMGLSPKRDVNGRLIPKRKTTTVIFPNQNRPQRVVTI
jgi:hypothetical protein